MDLPLQEEGGETAGAAENALEDAADEQNAAETAGDRVLSSLSASVDGGRTLRLDAIGQAIPDRAGHYAIREVQVYEDGRLLQTVSASDVPSDFVRQSNSVRDDFIESTSMEEAVAIVDVNFDGSDDLDLCGWVSSYHVFRHYWTWNSGVGRYLYACTLEGAEVDAKAGKVVSKYTTDSVYYTDVYRPAADGTLALVSRELEDWDRGTEDFPLLERYEYADGEGVLVHQEFTDYDDEGRTIREVRELVDGELIPVRLEELEVTDGSIRIIHAEEVPPPQPEIPEEEEFLEELIDEDGIA